ncbi:MAG: carbamoyl-phosphate synthase subunit L [Rhodobacterales bacterium]|nr:carbamoyl-phosphate synthase subunit L [Rhodobacterales bacterium]
MAFSKILVASRGEIAVRLLQAAHEHGYRSVAVYSDADANAPHVQLADEAVYIGGSASADSYLRAEVILDAARRTGADAIHPGYGFLAENADFAQSCADAGVTFIGPPPSAIRSMADKARAKAQMAQAGVPLIPGYSGDDDSPERLAIEAEKVGFPLLIKATAGGGGRGMRQVNAASELAEAIVSARREAQSAFSDGRLMLERLITGGRHIEVQVFGDSHGSVIHLGTRDCSAQRRRQKVVEEAPAPGLTAEQAHTIGVDAVNAAKAVGYQNAGTVEFLLDPSGEHYFLEMNTRLQVEHTVTEEVCDIDLVDWQFQVASGAPLPKEQDEIALTGHAIEARLYAEDPYNDFAPQTGTLLRFRPEAVTIHLVLRVDAGVVEGGHVTPFYDPMIAKIIAHGADRDEARRRLIIALQDLPIAGLQTNRDFLIALLQSSEFRTPTLHVNTLDEWGTAGAAQLQRPQPSDRDWHLAAALFGAAHIQPLCTSIVTDVELNLVCGEQTRTLNPRENNPVTLLCCEGDVVHYKSDGITRSARALLHLSKLHLAQPDGSYVFEQERPWEAGEDAVHPDQVCASVAGTVVAVQVAPGDSVSAGQNLAVVEAMKMETQHPAARAGTVAEVYVKTGTQVESGALLVRLEPLDGENTDGQ